LKNTIHRFVSILLDGAATSIGPDTYGGECSGDIGIYLIGSILRGKNMYAVHTRSIICTTTHHGIAPKDVAWLGIKALMEVEERVAKLEAK
jgi:hypothetical protein